MPGAEIEVTWPDDSTTTTIVDEDGNWEVNVPDDVDLEDGDVITVVQTEPDKDPSDPAQETVGGDDKDGLGNGKSDTPDIDVIYAGAETVSGNGTPGATIVVEFPDGSFAHTVVDGDTNWSVDVPGGLELQVGDEVFAMQHTPGNDPSDWAQRTVIEYVDNGPGRDVSDTPNVNEINEGDDAVTGQGVPGADIEVTWPDGSTSTGTVDEDGNWSVDVPDDVDLNDGDIVIVIQTEEDKDPSGPAQVTVGGGDKDGNGKSDTPNIDIIVAGDNAVSGNGVPGSTITVRFEDGSTAETTVGADRIWSVDVPAGVVLEEGDHVFAAQVTGDKDISDEAQRTVVAEAPPTRSDTPNIDPIDEGDKTVTGQGVPGAEIEVTWPDDSTSTATVDEDGNWAVNVPDDVDLVEGDNVTAVQKEPGKPESSPAQETVGGDTKDGPGNNGKSDTPDIDVIYAGADTVTGRGTPGSRVGVMFKNGVTVWVTVNDDSTWSADVPTGLVLNEGDKVYAQQRTPGKRASDWALRTVIDKDGDKDPNKLRSDTPNIDPIADTDTIVTGEGVPGASIKVTWKDGSTSTAKVSPQGKWAVKVPDSVTLIEGDIVEARQTEQGKPESSPAQETVNGDTKDGPGNNGYSDTPDIDNIYEGDTTVTGSGTPDSEITVRFKNGTTRKVKVGPDGKWSVNVPDGMTLEEGDIVNAMQSTPGKKPSKWAQKTVIGDGVQSESQSDTPNIDRIEEGDVAVTGQGVPGAEIEITWPDGRKSRVIVGRDGNWIAAVPEDMELIEDDIVTAVQREEGKLDSSPAQETVGGGDKDGNGKSDTPDIDVIYAGDETVTGRGTPGSVIVVVFPDYSTATAIVDEYDLWSVEVPGELFEGDEIYAIQMTDGKEPSDWAMKTVLDDGSKSNLSDTPNVDPIDEGDRVVTGEGEPGAEIIVTWPDDSESTTVVDEDGNWAVDVPEDVELEEDDIVIVVQVEEDKDPSSPAHVTVGGGDKDGDGKSDTPNVDIIREGDEVINGDGVPGSTIIVRMPDGKTVKTTVDEDSRWSVDVPQGTTLKKGDIVNAAQLTPGKEPSDWVQKTVHGAIYDKSDEPKVDPITEGDTEVTGEGTPGAEIVVTWPDGSESTEIVDEDGKWVVKVPDDVTLKKGDTVTVVQKEHGKEASDPNTETVNGRQQPETPDEDDEEEEKLETADSDSRTSSRPITSISPLALTEFGDEESPIAGFISDHIQYIKGYPWGTVGPDSPITRAETAEIIYRLLEASRSGHTLVSQFPDVTGNEWYAESVTYLASIGIVKGYLDGTFMPDNPITRAEFATMISGFDNLAVADYNKFDDVVGHWAIGYINSAAEKGWVSGYLDGEFKPENYITRAEVVSVINRMLNRRIEIQDVPDWAPAFDDLPVSHWAYTDITEASIGHNYERKQNGYEIWIEELR